MRLAGHIQNGGVRGERRREQRGQPGQEHHAAARRDLPQPGERQALRHRHRWARAAAGRGRRGAGGGRRAAGRGRWQGRRAGRGRRARPAGRCSPRAAGAHARRAGRTTAPGRRRARGAGAAGARSPPGRVCGRAAPPRVSGAGRGRAAAPALAAGSLGGRAGPNSAGRALGRRPLADCGRPGLGTAEPLRASGQKRPSLPRPGGETPGPALDPRRARRQAPRSGFAPTDAPTPPSRPLSQTRPGMERCPGWWQPTLRHSAALAPVRTWCSWGVEAWGVGRTASCFSPWGHLG